MNKEFITSLVRVQQGLKAPKGQYNSFAKYHYRSCEDILQAVKPLLEEHSLYIYITDEIEHSNGKTYIKATASITNGENTISTSALAREPETKKGMDDSQVTGTASSYARKYALNGLYNIDDTKDADTDAYKKQTTTNPAAVPEYKCGDCGKPFEAFRDPTSGKTFTPAEVFQMAKKRNADGVARCADCRKKKGGA